MSREVKRVPMGWDWPMKKTWEGYLNPHWTAKECHVCGGNGGSPQYRTLKDRWYGQAPFSPVVPFPVDHPRILALAERNCEHSPGFYGSGAASITREARRLAEHFNSQWHHHLGVDDVAALIEAGRLIDFTSEFIPGKGWVKKEPFTMPTPAEVNEWSLSGLGHDSINCHVVIGAVCEKEGWPTNCEHCEGHGHIWPNKEDEAVYEAWKNYEPPIGEGWQMWETTSEGSPMSPIFSTPEELAQWLTDSKASAFGRETATYSQWMGMIKAGWAMSAVSHDGIIESGVAFAGSRADV